LKGILSNLRDIASRPKGPTHRHYFFVIPSNTCTAEGERGYFNSAYPFFAGWIIIRTGKNFAAMLSGSDVDKVFTIATDYYKGKYKK
jgi:hypothetical protein